MKRRAHTHTQQVGSLYLAHSKSVIKCKKKILGKKVIAFDYGSVESAMYWMHVLRRKWLIRVDGTMHKPLYLPRDAITPTLLRQLLPQKKNTEWNGLWVDKRILCLD